MGVRKRMGNRNEGSSKNPWYFNLQPKFLMFNWYALIQIRKEKKTTLSYKYQSTCLKLNCYWFILWYLACLGHTLFIYVLLKIQSLTYTDLLKFVKVGGKKGLMGEILFVRIL